MAKLISPGAIVTVTDESFYTPAAPSTVPLIVIATAENKPNGANTGTAPGTLKANAGLVYLITSQRDLSETFGIAQFKTDINNNPIHAGEQNEYGLAAAYSYLGVSNRVYVVRADIDLAAINARAVTPESEANNGTHWLDLRVSNWGVFEWNGDPKGTGLGQTFIKRTPLIINDTKKVVDYNGQDYTPKASVGSIGDYAVVSLHNLDTEYADQDVLWFKSPGNMFGLQSGTWVKVGSEDWAESWPVAVSSKADLSPLLTAFTNGNPRILTFNAYGSSALENLSITKGTAEDIANEINSFSDYLKAGVTKNGRLALYLSRFVQNASISGNAIPDLGLTVGTLNSPVLVTSKHTQVPQFKLTDSTPRPSGSVWIKSTEPSNGISLNVKRYSTESKTWVRMPVVFAANGHSAIYELDKSGGSRLSVGSLYAKYNVEEGETSLHSGNIDNWADNENYDVGDKVFYAGLSYRCVTSHTSSLGTNEPPSSQWIQIPFPDKKAIADYRIFRKRASGATIVTSIRIEENIFPGLSAGDYIEFRMAEGLAGTDQLSTSKLVSYMLTNTADDADGIAGAINNIGFDNLIAEVNSENKVVIRHRLGNDFRIQDETGVSGTDMIEVMFAGETNPNLYDFDAYGGDYRFTASLWEPLKYTASFEPVTSLTVDQTLWYNSITEDVDIMVHNGQKWVGYRELYPNTNAAGPIVSSGAPSKQSDGVSPLVDYDLWVDISDIDAYPRLFRFDNSKPGPIVTRWVLVNTSDQTSEEGIIFFDARWNTTGQGKEAGRIADLLLSDHVDPDCPDPALYPKGMLLWNMRRSGFNVKKFVHNYIDTNTRNVRIKLIDGNGDAYNPIMSNYYPHRWVTISGNKQDGSGNFGRLAQRRVVIDSLQKVVNTSKDIREEARIFNLSACPGYPELIGELISLNFDRGLTAFIVGDTPSRLTPDATSLKAWGDNLKLSVEDNDLGGASYDEYLGMFYPWGFTSDNFGRNIVVPPSHMILRTIAVSDAVSFPWFAPAGTRRGGITNATSVGYVGKEGEFVTVALNTGQRDTLYEVKINPITFFTGAGLVNFGQKTRAKISSAMDRINVSRLVLYLRRQLDILAKPYIFEPNDKITRDEIRGAIESLMLELVGQRALYDYIVVCDDSNNTPSRIDKGELWVDVAIEPVKAVEFIYIPLRLKNTGEIAGL
ncbi:MAG: hypothetical protein EBT86_03480 [Actinobacteria bacterium]|nr:hypothetical protein [Actinomycetota bacterium]